MANKNGEGIVMSNDSELVEEPWFVYICESRAGHYYTGISPDPAKRLAKHNSGNGSEMAVDQGAFTLKYISLPYLNKSQARRRELQIKGWSRAKKVKLITGEWI